MPAPGRYAEERRLERRQQILDAALQLFTDKGFDGTAVPELADRARIGAGTIYRYFDSKEALVNALYQQHKAAIANAVIEGFPFDAPPRQQFAEFWSRVTAFAVKNPTAVRFLELHHHGRYLDDESRAVRNRTEQLAEAFLAQARTSGDVKDLSPDLLMAIVWGAFVGMVRASWEGRLSLTPAVIADAERCCWDAIAV